MFMSENFNEASMIEASMDDFASPPPRRSDSEDETPGRASKAKKSARPAKVLSARAKKTAAKKAGQKPAKEVEKPAPKASAKAAPKPAAKAAVKTTRPARGKSKAKTAPVVEIEEVEELETPETAVVEETSGPISDGYEADEFAPPLATKQASDAGDVPVAESDNEASHARNEDTTHRAFEDGESHAARRDRSRREAPSRQPDEDDEPRRRSNVKGQMLINYVPGEECRVAVVENGKLEELYSERFSSASRVGNIYVGKVVNVEPAIQAAFIDFGVGENGFLHVTDLHPKYFPGEDGDTTERVGFKTPRRERPPIQRALKRGDEVIVQVLKEGVGSKGPTVTSYLSIPGRFLVMMPGMDKVGVSRKVEDEEQRAEMRRILDQLDLPEGFGFILRTAGFQRTRGDLQRDLLYLQRLWKDMHNRLEVGGGKPRLLYSESDLLVRALRDMLSADIQEVIIDNEQAIKRASRFLRIVAPKGAAKLLHYTHGTPMFHAFGIERQIHLIHAREVPLPSGGRLVIDQTEALVAIDVNSGRSRDSRDSEDNAYRTNLEAVDEICRQLRLRDMGGIVINDLIDMRHASHRKDVENRFRDRLYRDRAKTTVLQISEFGILQMTRQRMRPSHESVHFTDCPACRGRGMLQRAESVSADALRDLSAVLDLPKVKRVEMVVAPRVAGDLLSTKRQLLSRIERSFDKHVDVRVSETVTADRVTFYAYDESGADIDLTTLPPPKKPRELREWVDPDATNPEWAMDSESEKPAESEPEVTEDDLPMTLIENDSPQGQHDLDNLDDVRGTAPREERDARGDRGARGDRNDRGRRDRGGERPERGAGRHEDRGPRDRNEGGRTNDRGGRGGPRRDDRPMRQDRPAPTARVGDDAAEWGEDAPIVRPVPRVEDAAVEVPEGVETESQLTGGEGQGTPGENGGRRKRRRRRGRGRGRGGEGAPQGDLGQSDAGESVAGGSPESNRDADASSDMMQDADAELDVGNDGELDAGDDQSAPEGSFGSDPSQGGEGGEGGRRRRRRRRGGRGRNRNRDDGGAPGVGGQDNRPEPRAEPRGEYVSAPRNEPRPENRVPAPQQPRVEASPTPQPPKPRTLYGAIKRKLTAAELNRRPKPE